MDDVATEKTQGIYIFTAICVKLKKYGKYPCYPFGSISMNIIFSRGGQIGKIGWKLREPIRFEKGWRADGQTDDRRLGIG